MRINGWADARRALGSWWYSTASARNESLFDGAKVFVIARVEVERVFARGRGQQRQAAHVVQQAGQVRFLVVDVLHGAGQVTRDHGGRQRVLPEGAQVGAAGVREIIEGLEDRVADDQRLDHVGAERDERLLQVHGAAGPVVRRTVGHGQQLDGHAGVVGNQGGQFGHAKVVSLEVAEQLDKNLWHGRQTGNQ
jgi:hypothetical protein